MRFSSLLLLMVLVSGCASSRSVVNVDTPHAATQPEQGTAIKITNVSDSRRFEPAPKQPDIPSLSGQDTNDKSLTARALGRKRNGFGKAWGDVLLPEDQTVSDLMKNTLVNSFREANYRVLAPGDVGYDKATPVEAQVRQYWSWLDVGFWQLTVRNRAEVEITGPLPVLNPGLTVRSEAAESMMAVTEDDWQKVSSQGLKNFSDNLVKALTGKPQIKGN